MARRSRGRDRFRLSYTRRVATPTRKGMVVRARRKMDAVQPSAEVSWMLPLPMYLTWEVLREVRLGRKYQRLWVVEVYPSYESSKAEVIAEATKYEAFDLVDAKAAELAAPPVGEGDGA